MFLQIGKDGSPKESRSTFDVIRKMLAPGESVYNTDTNSIIYVNNVGGVLPDFDVNTFRFERPQTLSKPQFEQILPLNFTGETKPATQEEVNSFPEGSLRTVDGKQEMLSGGVWRVLEGVSIGLDAGGSTGTDTGTGAVDATGGATGGDIGGGTGGSTGGATADATGDATGGATGGGTGGDLPFAFPNFPGFPPGGTGETFDLQTLAAQSGGNLGSFISTIIDQAVNTGLLNTESISADGVVQWQTNPLLDSALDAWLTVYGIQTDLSRAQMLQELQNANNLAVAKINYNQAVQVANIAREQGLGIAEIQRLASEAQNAANRYIAEQQRYGAENVAKTQAQGQVGAAQYGATPFGALAAAGADVNALQQALMTQSLGGQAGLTPEQRIQLALASTGGQYGALGGATGGYTAADIAALARGGMTPQQLAQQSLAATGGQYGALGLVQQPVTTADIANLVRGGLTAQEQFNLQTALARGGLSAQERLAEAQLAALPGILQVSPQTLGGLSAVLGQQAVQNILTPFTSGGSATSGMAAMPQTMALGATPTAGQYQRQTPYQQGATQAQLSMTGEDPTQQILGVTPGTGFESGTLGAQAV